MEFSGQEYWSGLPFPSPGDLPNPGIEPGSPALQADALPSEPPGKPLHTQKTNSKWIKDLYVRYDTIKLLEENTDRALWHKWQQHFYSPQFSSVQFSRSVVSDSLQPHESQHARPPCPSPTPGIHSSSSPSVGDAIQPSHPLSSGSPPAPNPSQHQSLFQWVNSSHQVAKVLEFQL